MEPSRSRLFLPGAGADPIGSEPESAPGPQTDGAALKSGGSATLSDTQLSIIGSNDTYLRS